MSSWLAAPANQKGGLNERWLTRMRQATTSVKFKGLKEGENCTLGKSHGETAMMKSSGGLTAPERISPRTHPLKITFIPIFVGMKAPSRPAA